MLPSRYTIESADSPSDKPNVGFITPNIQGANAPIKNANIIIAPETEARIAGGVTKNKEAYMFES
ncbi:hypothetical protein D3C86_1836070 [compost metagenome]